MKKVLIIGATGSLAQYVIEALKQLNGIELTLFVRSKSRLKASLAAGCAVVEGDAMHYGSVLNAVAGKDLVYVNLAGNLEYMTQNIVVAMEEVNVNRIIAISSIGIYDVPLKSVLVPYRKLADIIETTSLDYTILRPDWFTNGDEIDYAITRKPEPEKGTAVSRKSIAAFIATIVSDSALYRRENVGISRPK